MKLQAFRIKNFRSIKDTNWQNFSPDSITSLIGQNEAGKTAILEALYSFPTAEISGDVLRDDSSMPEVSCSFQVSWDEVKELFKDQTLPKGLAKLINERKRINLKRIWTDTEIEGNLDLEEEELSVLFDLPESETSEESSDNQKLETEGGEQGEKVKEEKVVTKEEFVNSIFDKTPEFEFFEDLASLLPDTIDLEDLQNKNTKAEGYKGAENLLAIAGLDLNFLQTKERRIVENHISSLNKNVTTNFQEFWRQKIGKTNKIAIEFELKHHTKEEGEKAGKPYLVFWIKDGQKKLYPKQRSKGVRWYTSFYLQLKASSLDKSKYGQVFLIDEPGGSLHARAQEDVLKVFEEIKRNVQVIYTTHSPYLIKLETIYRLLAVQRADEEDDKSETLVFDAHKLGATSSDTLSPIYTLMGADFSHQQVIKKNNNILLEEISAYYYISSFWKLINSQKEAYFLPATGTSNIPQLANLFLGWGLDFGVVVDDNNSGRNIYNGLKRDLFLDNENEAKKRILKIKGCSGIEDLFTNNDFKKYILEDASLLFKQKNSEYMKDKPKAIFALKFLLKAKDDKVKMNEFSKDTQNNIKNLVGEIESMLV
ncbi:MAG: ATP-binding protein [Candidatus Staskawiczbacteria bacterium]|nr:ATP-binding protein [Candidatus Staskawiczbacteria bacterium]